MSDLVAKLKASCDRCAADKVKCGKQHPSCARCIQTNRECVYSVSQRAGKPSQAKLAVRRELAACAGVPLISADASTRQGSAAGSPSAMQVAVNTELSNATSDFWQCRDLMLPSLPWQEELGVSGNLGAAHHSPAAYYDPCAALTGASLGTTLSGTTQFSLATSQQAITLSETLMDAACGEFSMSAPMSPKSSGRSSATLDAALGPPCCEPTEVAKQLCDIVELGQANAMTLDTLLHEIVTLSQKVSSHLRCSCARDSTVLMMLAASECEILDLYQAIADVKPCYPLSSGRAIRQLSLRHSELSLGSFKLDEKMSSAVRDQLVLSQLHDMIGKWEQYVDPLSYDRKKATGEVKLSVVITNLVLSRLNSTVDEIESRRRGSSRGS
ncbi:Fungal transcriptional regulatory protein [Cordyceps fumosorosea ARSEF 2679]|uniref:Fungal transcriptional regulatory protein n=1 Tax=Cordyceps fumosorosea (strain ARSEF 2679) TaxID=1081104 RepID=A0A162JJB6_CORFA|nr:Fungal transcriptional regulatory protein [Cordyceps fumosorosea ARSEF 2679]OAA45088.1 Fungal transcriptional regulatory protein [Cordyceps fumosorosea ARSEF 2679]